MPHLPENSGKALLSSPLKSNGRQCDDWLKSFIEYTSYGEAPTHFYFWAGVSALAGALQRKVWIDQAYFKWYCNFFICLVAPPGVVSKSTTSGTAMSLLRKVAGVQFGPEVVTWQSLITSFDKCRETFEYKGMQMEQAALTIESSEFGNLLDPSDKRMVDMFVTLWDGKNVRKETKNSGNDDVVNPFFNLIACTTPSWIAGNFPEYMIGGGLASRMIFAYADTKQKLVAYPGEEVPADLSKMEGRLLADLEYIHKNLKGEYRLTKEAYAWGKAWYMEHQQNQPDHLDDERFGGYLARKQTHMHKLAIVLAASEGNTMFITAEHLETANQMVTDLEADMDLVFKKIGKSANSTSADRLIAYVNKRGEAPYIEVYRYVHSLFPSMRDYEDIFSGCVKAGYIKLVSRTGKGEMVLPGEKLDLRVS